MITTPAPAQTSGAAFDSHHRNSINLLRALAVIAVVAHHLALYEGSAVPWLSVIGGQLGVQLFFLISGFLLVRSAGRLDWARFIAGRAIRILPCYWVALGMAAWLLGRPVMPAGPEELVDFIAQVLAIGHLRPYGLFRFDSLFVSWTLTVEWSWYVLLPPLAWLAARTRRPEGFWLAAAIVAAVLSYAWVVAATAGQLDGLYAVQLRRIGATPNAAEALRIAFITVAAPAQWVYFLLGALISVGGQWLERVPAWACLAVAFVLLADLPRTAGWFAADPNPGTGMGLAGLILAAQRMNSGGRWLALLHRVGDLSYPLYLLHVPLTMWVVARVPQSGAPRALLICVALGTAALLMHRLVELPTRGAGARWLAR